MENLPNEDLMLSSNVVRQGFIAGRTFGIKPITYTQVDGMAIFEGCIALGTVEEMESFTKNVMDAADQESLGDIPTGVEFGVGITGQRFRWPGCLVPYAIDPLLPSANVSRIQEAIEHWQNRTQFRFVLRTAANQASYPNYVNFIPSTGCWSFVGMRGDKQDIGLAPGCGRGSTIHEIGHACGLWHEQSREDRDRFISINWANIQAGTEHNFNQHITDGDDYGPYDYASIMHYGPTAFSRNGLPTIVPTLPGAPIGQRNDLSAGDVAAIRAMYPNCEASRSWLGVQFKGSIAAGNTVCWFTHSWPAHWHVDWNVVPLDPPIDAGAQIEWKIQVTRQSDKFLKYFICVKNLVSYNVQFEARYHVKGWLR